MILVDTNVIVDILARRLPYFAHSAAVVERVVDGTLTAAISAHQVTTLHYLVARASGANAADDAVAWLLKYFEVLTVSRTELEQARALKFADFEDAVIAAVAATAGCLQIVTRNVRDFGNSPVPAVAPEELVIDAIHEEFVARYAISARKDPQHAD